MSSDPNVQSLLSRIDRYLVEKQAPPAPEQTPPQDQPPARDAISEGLRAKLSGAFGQAIDVYPCLEEHAGTYLVAVPAALLKASGLRFVETAARPRVDGLRQGEAPLRVLVGSQEAVANATNRVARPLPEGSRVEIDSFQVGDGDLVYFAVSPAV